MNDEKRSYVFAMLLLILTCIITIAVLTCGFFIIDDAVSGAINIILKISLVLTEIFAVAGLIWAAVEITEMHKERKECEESEKKSR